MDETNEEILDNVSDTTVEPLEVIIKNPTKPEATIFDEKDDDEYVELKPSGEEIDSYYKEDES